MSERTRVLSRSFYERDTSGAAKGCLGKIVVHRDREGLTSGKIVETEAYYGGWDPASRASRGRTKMNEIMWGPAGRAFVYVVHGQFLFNVTSEREGVPGAVLIRALEPLDGIEIMKRRRGTELLRELASGPGKLTRAMAITMAHHGLDLTDPKSKLIIVEGRPQNFSIVSSHRIGVSKDIRRKLRFYIEGNPFVSR